MAQPDDDGNAQVSSASNGSFSITMPRILGSLAIRWALG
jgi:hypothetical protein